MRNLGEYRGQKIIGALTGRLIPPGNNYPDCECVLVLTGQHLYILEDNFDGTCDTHFEFVLGEVDDMQIEKIQSSSGSGLQPGAVSAFALEVVSVLGGPLAGSLAGPWKSTAVRRYFVISYHTELGGREKIYFNEFDSRARGFIKIFKKAKAAYGQGASLTGL